MGYERIFNDAADISLDIPTIYEFLKTFVADSVKVGLISKSMQEQIPTKGRKRYLSENDGGAIKN